MFGCLFGHTGFWDKPTSETWKDAHGSKFQKQVQFRTCLRCQVVEKHVIDGGVE